MERFRREVCSRSWHGVQCWLFGVLLACGSATHEVHMTSPTQHRAESDPEGQARRETSTQALRASGFRHSSGLPTTHRRGLGAQLRPAEDIARRLMALHALNLWVLASNIPDRSILDYVESNDLRSALTGDERIMLEASRDGLDARFGGRMGWTQENMWSLAWALGFDIKPTPDAPLIDDTVVGPMLAFLPRLDGHVGSFVQGASLRSEADVLDLEDLFYCAHNAVRSAQLGESDTVPPGFHPVRDGGAVHERRHALTWMISPGVSWEDTDLST